jgi:hypothetical protein
MSTQAKRITVSRSYENQNYFDVFVENQFKMPTVIEALQFDEMLGVVARLMIPTRDDGTPNRQTGTPLFLTPSKEDK